MPLKLSNQHSAHHIPLIKINWRGMAIVVGVPHRATSPISSWSRRSEQLRQVSGDRAILLLVVSVNLGEFSVPFYPAIAASLVAGLLLCVVPAQAQYWYWWCDASNAGYPWVRTCATPWRFVSPTPQVQSPTSQQVVPAPSNPNSGRSYGREQPPSIAQAAPDSLPSTAFRQGQADRQVWETWFNSQTGDYRAGAEYWAAHRSLPNPGSCNSSPQLTDDDRSAGCLAAQQRLAASDVRRKTEPEYRRGWNNPVPVSVAVSPPSRSEFGPAGASGTIGETGQGIGEPTKLHAANGETPAAPVPARRNTSTAALGNTNAEIVAQQHSGVDEEAEQRLIELIEEYATRYNEAPNEMAQGALRPERAKALCTLMPDRTVRDWVGTIETLSSTNDGRGILVVRISPHITVGTTNNAFSEDLSTEKTLIPTGSPLFAQAASMQTGQRVDFSGRLSGGQDCFRETSLTIGGDMTAPDFEMQFTAVRPAQ